MHTTKKNDPKSFWKLLKKLDCDGGEGSQNDSISSRKWVDHYKSLLQGESNKLPDSPEGSGPLDFIITLEELMKAKAILKGGKAPSVDNIINEMISTALGKYPQAFLHIFNLILSKGISSWSTSFLVPIHKKGPIDDLDNYRGIALISHLAKLFYSILNNRLLQYCIEHKILDPCQLGFYLKQDC